MIMHKGMSDQFVEDVKYTILIGRFTIMKFKFMHNYLK